MTFTNYLQQKGYSKATVSAYEKYIARFTGYIETVTTEINASSSDLQISDVVDKYGQFGSHLTVPKILTPVIRGAIKGINFLAKNNIDVGGIVSGFNNALESLGNTLKDNGLYNTGSAILSEVVRAFKDNKITFQYFTTPAEYKDVPNADGSKTKKAYNEGMMFRGYYQLENAVIVVQYTHQTEKK